MSNTGSRMPFSPSHQPSSPAEAFAEECGKLIASSPTARRHQKEAFGGTQHGKGQINYSPQAKNPAATTSSTSQLIKKKSTTHPDGR